MDKLLLIKVWTAKYESPETVKPGIVSNISNPTSLVRTWETEVGEFLRTNESTSRIRDSALKKAEGKSPNQKLSFYITCSHAYLHIHTNIHTHTAITSTNSTTTTTTTTLYNTTIKIKYVNDKVLAQFSTIVKQPVYLLPSVHWGILFFENCLWAKDLNAIVLGPKFCHLIFVLPERSKFIIDFQSLWLWNRVFININLQTKEERCIILGTG